MSVSYEDTNFDFDLDFLNTGSVKSVVSDFDKGERSRKAVLITKKKIIATDSLIRRYYDKRDEVEQLERSLQTSKEECKKICLDFKSITEKYNILEKEVVNLRISNAELSDLYSKSESVNGAINSHANQLQVLVKEKEATIDSLHIENQLLKASVRDNEKHVSSLEKENADIRKDIALLRSIIIGKRKLNKNSKFILKKYEKCILSGDEDSVFEDDIDSDIENEAHQTVIETPLNSNIKGASIPSKNDNGHDSDCSNELASADTGRGSSLASSDGEKCFNSPDYFLHHSPIDIHQGKEKRIYVNTATSPIVFAQKPHIVGSLSEYETIKMVLSPINNEDEPEYKVDLTDNVIESENQPSLKNDANTNSVLSETNNDNDIDIVTGLGNPEIERTFLNNVDMPNTSPVNNKNSKINPKAFSIFDPEDGADSIINTETDNISISSVDNQDSEIEHVVVIAIEPEQEESLTNCLDTNEILLFDKQDGEINNIGVNEVGPEQSLSCNLQTDSGLAVDARDDAKNSATILPILTNNADISFKENNAIEINAADLNTPITANNIPAKVKDAGRPSVDRNSTKNNNLNILSTSPVRLSTNSNQVSCNEKECLELNNSDNLNETNGSDCEIELILNKMRFNQMLITPIPSTPSKTHKSSDERERSSKVCRGKEHECKVAAKVKQESKILHEKYSKLEQEVQLIKDILRNKLAINDLHLNLAETDELRPNHSPNKINNGGVTGHNIYNVKTIVTNEEPLSSLIEQNEADTEMVEASITDSVKVLPQREEFLLKTKEIDEMLNSAHHHLSDTITRDTSSLKTNNGIIDCGQVNDEPDSISVKKHRKLSKLEKLRRNLVPKSKIKNNINSPTRHKRTTPKQLSTTKKTVVDSDSAATLNDKSVYEKAVQIMSELKSQNKCMKPQDLNPDKSIITNDIPEEHENYESIEKKNQISVTSPLNKLKTNHCKKELVVAIVKCDENTVTSPSPKQHISTRSHSKLSNEESTEKHARNGNMLEFVNNEIQLGTRKRLRSSNEVDPTEKHIANGNISENIEHDSAKIGNNEIQQGTRKRQKRESIENHDVPCKRILRSSNLSPPTSIQPHSGILSRGVRNSTSEIITSNNNKNTPSESATESLLSYSDIEMFTNDNKQCADKTREDVDLKALNPKEIIFCSMIDKYGKQTRKNCAKKLPESIIASTTKKLQDEINNIMQLNSNEAKIAMNKLVNIVQAWECKRFIAALMSYLKDEQRKLELFNKILSPPAPPMTKSEQVLLFVISQLMQSSSIDILDCILCNIQYELFKLNRTPDFDTIESMSHFYAVLCRYFKLKSRLRLFMLDAMYCMQFKAVPLIKQCLDVWMHVLPLAHMGIAKSPLVTCLVYLLHFYKCEDKLNRVQEIRNILNRKYFYEITEWNEPKMIEMFKNAILEVRAMPIESKMLRIALIVAAKRHGPKWCQKNIVKTLLLPVLEKKVPDRIKIFCISLLGPLLKPYPVDMKVHCEIVMNLLLDKLKQNPSLQMQEAIITSLIYMCKHNQNGVLQALLTWKPQQVSPEMERLLKDFVAEKPLKVWRAVLSKVQLA